MDRKTGREAKVQELLDKQDIYEALMRYCRAVDRCDEPLLRSVYHPDATDERHLSPETAPEFCARAMATVRTMKLTEHSISNVLIELKGDVAYSEAYCHAYHRIERDGKDYDVVVGLRYLDRFERRNGMWKIAKRRVAYDWNRSDPSTEQWGDGFLSAYRRMGRRGPEDLVYQRDA
ncbi:MAG: nuclear transport factor 2 family protein [Chloroflexi bacterium]|nr:nuclear transport factor 2 family protein [Chloroflexota bacterium]